MRTTHWIVMTVLVGLGCDEKRDVDADWNTDSGYSGPTTPAGSDDDGAADDGATADDGAADDGASDDGAADDIEPVEITQVDEWEVPEDPPTDILFYLDQSASMEDNQDRMAAQTTTFIESIEGYSDDWQIIVANADNGCNQTSGILNAGTSDYVTRFQSAMSDGGLEEGETAWWTEAGLTITSNAIDQTDSGECNQGFLRSDAMLHIIMMSDESEQSTGSWSWYVDKVVAKKGSASLVRFSAIAGDWPGGCETADPGEGYHQAVTATGGVFLSICSDWATPANMSRLALASALPYSYALSQTPLVDSLRVWVNGTERMEAWSHTSDTNSIVFVAPIPSMGDHIRVEYSLLSSEE